MLADHLLLVIDSIKRDVGRGGALVKDKFVYALLDWSHVSRSACRFLDTHSQEMGLGPPAPRNAQHILTIFKAIKMEVITRTCSMRILILIKRVPCLRIVYIVCTV